MIQIRFEKPEDLAFIRSVNEQAFDSLAEAKLVDKLRLTCSEHLSLVADDNSSIVGHIMFTPVLVTGVKQKAQGMGLAPMAVLPSRQRQGTGTMLAKYSLQILREKKCPFVIVLGHPDYYPRFGFLPAFRFNIRSQWEGIPDNAFMVLFMDDNAKKNVSGVATFRDEFNDAL
jgi:putative acetyltransferase